LPQCPAQLAAVAVVAPLTTPLTLHLAVALVLLLLHQVALMGLRPVVQHLVQAQLVEAVVNLILHPLLTPPLAHNQPALASVRLASAMSRHLKLSLNLVVALVHHLLLRRQFAVIQPVKYRLSTLTR
jgi:hypothetical protein